jgi:hypothetical protein
MLRNLGRMIWSQTRDMNVLNYPQAIIYEVRTSDGDMFLKFCKKTEVWALDKKRNGDFAILFKDPLPSETLCDKVPSHH